ncbi:ectonucleotide pyrophosphatase/phosphodiesterase [Sphingomonas sp. S1-29]|uniref:alkaline phosphatase family protein n=1 Tax=Sphingomonas sp. S1-29 TaxID=2991074 RepID=UPI00223EF36C|nr:ectonucleotide pyrophosphatase/phosphodiesterase [Sphingomonas sp. S1-29]UZK69196.1 ectonucleotide pyrophosphatase/phosphodiesterase [Sphingomonas sp. S1-29]
MHLITRLTAVALAAALQACAAGPAIAPEPRLAAASAEQREPVTILLSIDGFHPDYLQRGLTPNLSRLAAQGVQAPMRPSFPTKTFPNHYAIVTGLHPDRNGIVANRFEDPTRPDEVFTMANLEPYWWDQAEPIWVTAEKAGIRTATMFWPGSNSKVRDTYPSDWQQFAQALPERNRVAAVVDWLRRPAATRPKLVTLYFDTVDTAGHRFGPQSPEANKAIGEADAQIGDLMRELDTLGQPANLIVVSDHGMAEVSADRTIDLLAAFPASDIRLAEDGPYASFHAQPGREAAVRAALAKPHPHMRCWEKGELPARLAYGRNPRVPPYICIADSGWTILGQPPKYPVKGGAHGYDNADPAMHSILVANGPAFRRGVTLPIADNVDVYALLRHLAGLPAATDVDARIEPLRAALAE